MPFTASIFGCLANIPPCIDILCCPTCQIGRLASASEGVPNTMDLMWCLGSLFCAPLMVPLLRCRVSEKYNLGEGPVGSILFGCCCAPCSLCQMNREMALHGVPPGWCCCGGTAQEQAANNGYAAMSPVTLTNAPPPAGSPALL